MAMWVIAVVGAAPCQCFSPSSGGEDTVDGGAARNRGKYSCPLECPRDRGPELDSRIWPQAAAAHHIERARMSSPLAAVRLSIASDGNSSTVEPSVDTSSPLRRHLAWMVSA